MPQFDPYFLIITKEEQKLLKRALSKSTFWFDLVPVANTAALLARLKTVLESRSLSVFCFAASGIREDQIEPVQEFMMNLRLSVKRLYIYDINFGLDGFDRLIDNAIGLGFVYFEDCSSRNWTANQQTAVVNSLAKSETITTAWLYWTPLEDVPWGDLLQVPSLRTLGLKFTDNSAFNLLMEQMNNNTTINELNLYNTEWPVEAFQELGKMLAVNKVLRKLDCFVSSYPNDFLAMHPMIQLNTTLYTLKSLVIDLPESALWSECKSICDGDAELEKNLIFQLKRNLAARDALVASRTLMLLDLPLELMEILFRLMLQEWFSIDSRLLTRVLLDRCRIGLIQKLSYTNYGALFDASLLITCCYLDSRRVD